MVRIASSLPFDVHSLKKKVSALEIANGKTHFVIRVMAIIYSELMEGGCAGASECSSGEDHGQKTADSLTFLWFY